MFKAYRHKFEDSSDNIAQRPAMVKKGIVINIYPEKATCDIQTTDVRSSVYSDVPYATGYTGVEGNGIDICPEVGSYCYFIAGDSGATSKADAQVSAPTVFCFFNPRTEKGSLGNRTQLSPGDIRLSAGSGEMLLRNNGDVYLFSGPTMCTAYLSTQQLVRSVSPSYMHDTLGGGVSWLVNSDIDGGPVDFTATVKKSATDTFGYLTLAAGEGNNNKVTLTVNDSGDEASNSVFILDIPIDGSPTELVSSNGLNVSTGLSPISLNGRAVISQTSIDMNVGDASILLENKETSKITISADEIVINTSKPLVINIDGEEIVRIEKETLKRLLTDSLLPWLKTIPGAPIQPLEALEQSQAIFTKSKLS